MVNPFNLSLANFKVNKKVTVSAKSTGTVEVEVPGDAYSFVTDIGYTKKLNTTYKLSTGHDLFNWGENQVGSQTVPYLFNPPRQINRKLVFIIENNANTDREYGVSFGIGSTGTVAESNDEGSVLPDISRFSERIKIEYNKEVYKGDSLTTASGNSTGTSWATIKSFNISQDQLDQIQSSAIDLGYEAIVCTGTISYNSGNYTHYVRIRNATQIITGTTYSIQDVNAGSKSFTIHVPSTSGFALNDNIIVEIRSDNGSGTQTVSSTLYGGTSFTKNPSGLSGYYVDELYVAANTTIRINESSDYDYTSNTTVSFTEPVILNSFSFESGDILYVFEEA